MIGAIGFHNLGSKKYKKLQADNLPLLLDIIEKAKTLVHSWDGEIYFVYLPHIKTYAKGVVDRRSSLMRQEVLDAVRKLDIATIDVHEKVFATTSDPLVHFPFRIRRHYTADGYKRVAQAIIEEVQTLEYKQ